MLKKDNSYLNAKDAAKLLHIGRSTLYSYVKQGFITPIKIGRKFLFHPEEIRKQLENGNSGSVEQQAEILEEFKIRMADKKTEVSPELMVAVETLLEIMDLNNQSHSA